VKGELERVYVPDRAAWRAWLESNHDSSPGVWLIFYKKESGKPRVAYDAAVEEALCYGWIDSVANKLDAERYMQFFSPRRPGSGWSALNKRRVERLAAAGLIALAQVDGSWTRLDAVESMVMPEDLRRVFARKKRALAHWEGFSRSVKKGILGWIGAARRPETRRKRIAETVAMAGRGLRAQFDREADEDSRKEQKHERS